MSENLLKDKLKSYSRMMIAISLVEFGILILAVIYVDTIMVYPAIIMLFSLPVILLTLSIKKINNELKQRDNEKAGV